MWATMFSDLLSDLPPTQGYAFVGPNIAIAGRGVIHRFHPSDPERRWVQTTQWLDTHLEPDGVAFVSFTFDPYQEGSEVVICQQVAEVETNGQIAEPLLRPRQLIGKDDPAAFIAMVETAIDRLKSGIADKIVLSRVMELPAPGVTVPMLAAALHETFPMCMTFVHDRFVGASPELLLRRRGRAVTSLVLAGSAPVGEGATLLASAKDRNEHQLARDSVVQALTPFAEDVHADTTPFLLELPNVVHLASYIHAQVPATVPTLHLLDAIHPTAAVCGTPRRVALDQIRDLEPEPRHTFAGPTGVIRGNGDCDIALALRCVRLGEDEIARAHVGCGIMPDSDPLLEAHETQLKVAAVRDVIADLI